MHNFYLQYPPLHKWFDPWDVKVLLSLLESWAPASFLTNLNLSERMLPFYYLLMQSIVLI